MIQLTCQFNAYSTKKERTVVVVQWPSTYLLSIHHLRVNLCHEGKREVSVSTAFISVLDLEDPTVDYISPQRCEYSERH